MTDRFKNKYRILSSRAPWHDYNGGIYFVTINTYNRQRFFGEVVDDGDCHFRMDLSEIGKYADECVIKMESLHDDIHVPLYQIMPHHIHLIIVVDSPSIVETSHCDVSTEDDRLKNVQMQTIANRCGRLSHIISGFKYAVTFFARKNDISFAWQSRFYDRIIRDVDELNHIAAYIENNVPKWGCDELNGINND